MGRFVKGDVVVTPFPFSDLQAAKRRPALVVATFTGDKGLEPTPDGAAQARRSASKAREGDKRGVGHGIGEGEILHGECYASVWWRLTG